MITWSSRTMCIWLQTVQAVIWCQAFVFHSGIPCIQHAQPRYRRDSHTSVVLWWWCCWRILRLDSTSALSISGPSVSLPLPYPSIKPSLSPSDSPNPGANSTIELHTPYRCNYASKWIISVVWIQIPLQSFALSKSSIDLIFRSQLLTP